MTIAAYVANEQDATCLIPWGVRFASAAHTDLLIICSKRSKGKIGWEDLFLSECDENAMHEEIYKALSEQDQSRIVLKQDIASGAESSGMERVAVHVKEFTAPSPAEEVAGQLSSHGVSMLLVRADEPTKSSKNEQASTVTLFQTAACDACLIRGPAPKEDQPLRILVATHGHTEIELELKSAKKLAKAFDGKLTVLYVRPDDDEVAVHVARRNLYRMLEQVSGSHDEIDKRIELADSLLDGIQAQDLNQFDLLFVGSRRVKTLRKVFRGIVDDPNEPFFTAVATMRKGIPFTSRMWTKLTAAVRSKVPQLERDQRIELVDRLQNNSTFDFDFVALISLSTLIAGLGLIRNSSAVVIGAMLVAPLMTPLVGIGLALVHGNVRLIRDAFRSVIFGFAVAFAISIFLGLVIPGIAPNGHLNSEMLSRCEPNLLDLVVALVSGIAGAYATGRPNLIGALPGVAIAAALVPPIATSGIAFSLGFFYPDLFHLAWGAFLLFFTNIVAIILGTSFVFWGIGINSTAVAKEGRPAHVWPRYWFFGFVILSFLLAAIMSTREGPVDEHIEKKSKTEQPVEASNSE